MSIVQRLEQVWNDEDAKDLPKKAWAAKHLITFARGGHRHQVQIDMSIAALNLSAGDVQALVAIMMRGRP